MAYQVAVSSKTHTGPAAMLTRLLQNKWRILESKILWDGERRCWSDSYLSLPLQLILWNNANPCKCYWWIIFPCACRGREVYQKWLENKTILKSVMWIQFKCLRLNCTCWGLLLAKNIQPFKFNFLWAVCLQSDLSSRSSVEPIGSELMLLFAVTKQNLIY